MSVFYCRYSDITAQVFIDSSFLCQQKTLYLLRRANAAFFCACVTHNHQTCAQSFLTCTVFNHSVICLMQKYRNTATVRVLSQVFSAHINCLMWKDFVLYTHRQTDRHAQTGAHTRTDRHTDTHRQTDTHGQTDTQTDRRTRTDRHTDRQTHTCFCIQ